MDVNIVIAILSAVVPIIAGLAAWNMSTMDRRITSMEGEHEKLQQDKLDKEQYRRDQDKLELTMKEMRDDIRNLPDKITNLITLMVSNTAGK